MGVVNMLTENGVTRATDLDNVNGYPNVSALYQLASQDGEDEGDGDPLHQADGISGDATPTT